MQQRYDASSGDRRVPSSGFTLIEMVVVFTVVALLSTIGLASFSRFATTQSLQVGAQEVNSVLTMARSRALSQVIPSQCTGQQLQGYQVALTPGGRAYELDVLCAHTSYPLQKQNLPAHTIFLQGSLTPVIFQPATGTATAGQIILNGDLGSKVITINPTGTIRLASAAVQPTPTLVVNTPTPPPTATPQPTPTATPTPKPTAIPTIVPTSTPRPTITAPPTLTPTPAAIAFDAKSTIQKSSTTSLSWNHTTTTQSDRLLLVGISLHSYSVNVSSVSYNGIALTKAGSANCGLNFCRAELWYLVNPASGTHSVVVTLNATTDVVAGALTYTNVSQTTPIGTIVSGGGVASSGTLTLPATKTTQMVIDSFAGGGTNSFAPGSSQTQQWYNFTQQQGSGSTRPASANSTTVTWSAAGSDDWADIAVSLNPAP